MEKNFFEFVYANGYASKEFFSENMELLGIRISESTILYHGMFSEHFPGYEAAVRGLYLKDFRLQLLSREDIQIVRHHRDEINTMLELCGASFRIPEKGVCWIGDCKTLNPSAIGFVSGRPYKSSKAWALYKRI